MDGWLLIVALSSILRRMNSDTFMSSADTLFRLFGVFDKFVSSADTFFRLNADRPLFALIRFLLRHDRIYGSPAKHTVFFCRNPNGRMENFINQQITTL